MIDRENLKAGAVFTLERVIPARAAREMVPPDWRGRVSELCGEALRAFWAEAVGHARREIGRYARWQEQDEPVLPAGYDAESVVEAAFERLICREAGSVPILYSAEDIRRELRVLIKHRVNWLHERSETGLVVGEWDVLSPRPEGELVSILDCLPAGTGRPDEELMRKEKQELLGEFKAGLEGKLGSELVEVFRRLWDGQRQREIAQGLGAKVTRVKALQAQLQRRLAGFGESGKQELREFS